jgi:hypothetical protein
MSSRSLLFNLTVGINLVRRAVVRQDLEGSLEFLILLSVGTTGMNHHTQLNLV